MGREAKTGQSTDAMKEALLSPALTEKILGLPIINTGSLSIIDVGTGDASYSKNVVNNLVGQNVCVENLALLDADIEIFPDLLTTALTTDLPHQINVQAVETNNEVVRREFLRQFREQYDVAISQLVVHQILEDSEMSYLMYATYQALKPNGALFLIDLHPRFIKFLAENEPEKLKLDGNNGGGVGEYSFDSGGSTMVRSREMEFLLSEMLGLGFNFEELMPIIPSSIAEKKDRYGIMTEKDIPMFFLMQLRKSPENFVSSTEGVVDSIEPHPEKWLDITFIDGYEITIPRFANWEVAKKNDRLALLEIHRPENNAGVLNCWITRNNEEVKTKVLVWDQKVMKVVA